MKQLYEDEIDQAVYLTEIEYWDCLKHHSNPDRNCSLCRTLKKFYDA